LILIWQEETLLTQDLSIKEFIDILIIRLQYKEVSVHTSTAIIFPLSRQNNSNYVQGCFKWCCL